MEAIIRNKLREIERTEGARILYATESGSRAWGFASSDSDWDVRFIYVRPRDWYLSVKPGRDVLEFPIDDDLDISGWDLKKALGLMAKSNPPLFEWLGSPVTYVEEQGFLAEFQAFSKRFFVPRSAANHYLSMATNNFRSCAEGDRVRLKRYLYALRTGLAASWVVDRQTMPPTEFQPLVDAQLPSELRDEVAELVRNKKLGNERLDGPRRPALSSWLEAALPSLEKRIQAIPKPEGFAQELLDTYFRSKLR